jgi:hypothetical protein
LICWARAWSLATVAPPAVEERDGDDVVDDDPELLLPHAAPAAASAIPMIGITIDRTEGPPWTRRRAGSIARR